MESLDFVVDLIEKLRVQNIDYFVVTMRHGDEECKTDVFFDVKNDESFFSLEQVLKQLNNHPKLNEPKKATPPKKRNTKKKPSVKKTASTKKPRAKSTSPKTKSKTRKKKE